MNQYETVTVPFTTLFNRQCLTTAQVYEMPWLSEFIQMFASCFEFDDYNQVWWFYPEEEWTVH